MCLFQFFVLMERNVGVGGCSVTFKIRGLDRSGGGFGIVAPTNEISLAGYARRGVVEISALCSWRSSLDYPHFLSTPQGLALRALGFLGDDSQLHLNAVGV